MHCINITSNLAYYIYRRPDILPLKGKGRKAIFSKRKNSKRKQKQSTFIKSNVENTNNINVKMIKHDVKHEQKSKICTYIRAEHSISHLLSKRND